MPLLALALTLLPAVTFAQSKYSDIAAGMQHACTKATRHPVISNQRKRQLGDGTTVSRDKPVKVLDNVRQISAGDCSSYAVRNDGSLWAWGWNKCGQLGDGTKTDRLRPVKTMHGQRAQSRFLQQHPLRRAENRRHSVDDGLELLGPARRRHRRGPAAPRPASRDRRG